jgi:hypothetical protein
MVCEPLERRGFIVGCCGRSSCRNHWPGDLSGALLSIKSVKSAVKVKGPRISSISRSMGEASGGDSCAVRGWKTRFRLAVVGASRCSGRGIFDRPGGAAHAILDVGIAQGRAAHHRVVQLAALDAELQFHAAAQIGVAGLGYPAIQVAGPRARHEGQRESIAQHRGIHAAANHAVAGLVGLEAAAGWRWPCWSLAPAQARACPEASSNGSSHSRFTCAGSRLGTNVGIEASRAHAYPTLLGQPGRIVEREAGALARGQTSASLPDSRRTSSQIPAPGHGGEKAACRVAALPCRNHAHHPAEFARETHIFRDRSWPARRRPLPAEPAAPAP